MTARSNRPTLLASGALLLVLATGAVAAPPAGETTAARTAPSGATAPKAPDFPGTAPWKQVPREKVAKECGLSPELLDAAEPQMSQAPYAIYRYGKLCWVGGDEAKRAEKYHQASETKTMAALLFGIVASRTDVDENTLVRDWIDRTDQSADAIATGITRPPLHPDTRVFHLLTMTGTNTGTTYGTRLVPWFYDALGWNGLNSLILLIDKVVAAHPEAFPGSTNARELAINELFTPLGMTSTSWPGVAAAYTLESNLFDMGRLGELMLRKGRWGDKQLIDEDYVYRMTHPQVEDIQTHYGYLTWLNVAAGQAGDNGGTSDLDCSPFTGWRQYPHPPLMDAPHDHGANPFAADGADVGVFWGHGAGGQITQVHRALDLVIQVRDNDSSDSNEVDRMWTLLRPALVDQDPVYKGNEAGFCEAYRRGAHTPSLLSPWSTDAGFGSVRLDATAR